MPRTVFYTESEKVAPLSVIFHSFSMRSATTTIHANGPRVIVHEPVAIIEDSDGLLKAVPIDNIRFVPPTCKLNSSIIKV